MTARINKLCRVSILPYVALFLLLLAFLMQYQSLFIDDAYITLCYVKNIIHHQVWGMLANTPSNSATSPLNVIVLTGISLLTGNIEFSVILLAAFLLTAGTYTLVLLSQKHFNQSLPAYLAASLLIFNPLILSTLGLESLIFNFFIIASVWSFDNNQFRSLVFCLVMLTLTRAEGVVFLAAFIFFTKNHRQKLNILLWYGLLITPWFLFSWIYLGSFVPDTLFIKIGQGSWGDWSYHNGLLLYLKAYPSATVLSIMSIFLFPFVLSQDVCKEPLIQLLLTCLGLHFLAYSLLHVPPYHWYFAPDLLLLILISSFSFGFYLKKSCRFNRSAILSRLLLLLLFLPPAGIAFLFYQSGWQLAQTHIHTNWAKPHEYKKIAHQLKEAIPVDKGVDLQGEIGTLAYFSDRYLYDVFSDRGRFISLLNGKIPPESLKGKLIKINHWFSQPSPPVSSKDYILTVSKNTSPMVQKYLFSSAWSGDQAMFLYQQ